MNPEAAFHLGMQLISSCSRGDSDSVGRLLRFGADPCFVGPHGQGPLHAVVLSEEVPVEKQIALIAQLARAGAAVNLPNATGTTPLMLAAREPKLQQALLDAGADPNVQDKNGDTAIVWTISVNRASSIDHLIAAGADVSLPGQHARTPLAWAAYRGNLSYARSLLSAGASLDSADAHGTTPLMIALSMRHSELALALADAGADLRARNHAGIPVIVFAARANNKLVLERAKAGGEKLFFLRKAWLRLQGLALVRR
jgi:ankyrin repeat protein